MKFTKDVFNNVGRRCNVRGDAVHRIWRVRAAMRTAEGETHYLCRHTITGEYRAVNFRLLSSLY